MGGNWFARQVRQLSRPMGRSGRQDISYNADTAEEVKSTSGEDDFEYQAGYRKARQQLKKGKEGSQGGEPSATPRRTEGELNCTNPRAGEKSRRYFCDSQRPLSPRCPLRSRPRPLLSGYS